MRGVTAARRGKRPSEAGWSESHQTLSLFSFPCPQPQIFAFYGGLELHRVFSSSLLAGILLSMQDSQYYKADSFPHYFCYLLVAEQFRKALCRCSFGMLGTVQSYEEGLPLYIRE